MQLTGFLAEFTPTVRLYIGMKDRKCWLDGWSEEKLAAACRRGEKRAYAVLVRRHAPQVFAVCLGMLASVHDAEDVAQDALVKGLTQIDQLRAGEHFRAWIAGIARNLCLDHLRREKRGREVLARRQAPEPADRSAFAELEGAIHELPEQYRLPLLLYYLDGQSTENVASALNLSPDGVRTRLSRARKELRKRIGKQGSVQ